MVLPDLPAPGILRDISGMAWVDGDRFLVVHDAKDPESTRVTLVHLPSRHGGPLVEPLEVRWPDAISHDLESVARIPGTDEFLLSESGDDGRGSRRIFRVALRERELEILETVEWPVEILNVEGVAVGEVDGEQVLVFAERSQGNASTLVQWLPVEFGPMRFGMVRSVEFTLPSGWGANRPIVALEVDADGTLYGAAAFDPDEDAGPFTSAVFRIGRLARLDDGPVGVQLLPAPELLGAMNGLKIEGVALRPRPGGAPELFYGTDDEYYGGILRPLRPTP